MALPTENQQPNLIARSSSEKDPENQ